MMNCTLLSLIAHHGNTDPLFVRGVNKYHSNDYFRVQQPENNDRAQRILVSATKAGVDTTDVFQHKRMGEAMMELEIDYKFIVERAKFSLPMFISWLAVQKSHERRGEHTSAQWFIRQVRAGKTIAELM